MPEGRDPLAHYPGESASPTVGSRKPIQGLHDVGYSVAHPNIERRRHSAEIIDDREHPVLAAIEERVRQEVHRPAFIGGRRWRPVVAKLRLHPQLRCLIAQLQAHSTAQPMRALRAWQWAGQRVADRGEIGDECDLFGPRGSLDLRHLRSPLALFGHEMSLGLAVAASRQDPAQAVTHHIEAAEVWVPDW